MTDFVNLGVILKRSRNLGILNFDFTFSIIHRSWHFFTSTASIRAINERIKMFSSCL